MASSLCAHFPPVKGTCSPWCPLHCQLLPHRIVWQRLTRWHRKRPQRLNAWRRWETFIWQRRTEEHMAENCQEPSTYNVNMDTEKTGSSGAEILLYWECVPSSLKSTCILPECQNQSEPESVPQVFQVTLRNKRECSQKVCFAWLTFLGRSRMSH